VVVPLTVAPAAGAENVTVGSVEVGGGVVPPPLLLPPLPMT
jgi:hypothetical protein